MVLRPQLWVVAVQYKDEPSGDWGRWSVHRGTAEDMARVFDKLSVDPTVQSILRARVHAIMGEGLHSTVKL